VSLDAVRADRLGCYGYPHARTPFIDSLAREGVLFENAMTSAPFTSASHASILTGLYPPRHGIRVLFGYEERKLRTGVATLPELMKDGAFRTAAFVSAGTMDSRRTGLSRGFDLYREEFGRAADGSRAKRDRPQRRCEETLDECRRWLGDERPEKAFVLLHLFDAHDGMLVPPEGFIRELPVSGEPSGRPDAYDREVAWMDRQLGRFFEDVESLLSGWHIIVFLLSDHGQGLGDHHYHDHTGRLYQEQLHVPLIWAGGSAPKNLRVSPYVRTVDVTPTVLEEVGLKPPVGIDGRSLAGLARGSDTKGRVCYSETIHPIGASKEPLFAIIVNGRKLIFSPLAGRYEYYDLLKDPGEAVNLAPGGGFDDLKREMSAFDLSARITRSTGRGADPDEELRQLGYVE